MYTAALVAALALTSTVTAQAVINSFIAITGNPTTRSAATTTSSASVLPGSLALGAICNPLQASQCANGAVCFLANGTTQAVCGGFGAPCVGSSQCFQSTCVVGTAGFTICTGPGTSLVSSTVSSVSSASTSSMAMASNVSTSSPVSQSTATIGRTSSYNYTTVIGNVTTVIATATTDVSYSVNGTLISGPSSMVSMPASSATDSSLSSAVDSAIGSANATGTGMGTGKGSTVGSTSKSVGTYVPSSANRQTASVLSALGLGLGAVCGLALL